MIGILITSITAIVAIGILLEAVLQLLDLLKERRKSGERQNG